MNPQNKRGAANHRGTCQLLLTAAAFSKLAQIVMQIAVQTRSAGTRRVLVFTLLAQRLWTSAVLAA